MGRLPLRVRPVGSGATEPPETSLLGGLARLELSRGRRVAVGFVGVVVVVLLGYLDFITPAVLSLAVLYVLVVVATTLLAGIAAGMLTALASTLAWVIGDSALIESDWPTYLVNGALRLAALTVVVILVDRLVDALSRARRSERRGREFLSTAAHQLRTPIAGVRASADALSLLETSPEQEVLLANLMAETARAGRLVNSLLRVARLDQGEGMLRAPVRLSTITSAEVERSRVMVRGDVSVITTGDQDPIVFADADATREAIANLLDNARRHARTMIRLDVEVSGRHARLAVSDDGPGLPEGAGEQAFARFATLDGAGGSGLGLSIARTIARGQDGDLVFEGGRFVLSLPLVGDDDVASLAPEEVSRSI